MAVLLSGVTQRTRLFWCASRPWPRTNQFSKDPSFCSVGNGTCRPNSRWGTPPLTSLISAQVTQENLFSGGSRVGANGKIILRNSYLERRGMREARAKSSMKLDQLGPLPTASLSALSTLGTRRVTAYCHMASRTKGRVWRYVEIFSRLRERLRFPACTQWNIFRKYFLA